MKIATTPEFLIGLLISIQRFITNSLPYLLLYFQRASVDNLYNAADNNNGFPSSKSRSAATSPTSGSSYKVRLAGSTTSGIAQKNAAATPSSTNSSPRRSGNTGSKTSNEAWVCPNDRQLALRAK